MLESILVVDDDEELLLYCGTLLKSAGYDVSTFNRAQELLSRLGSKPADLVLTDLQMPGAIDGRGVVQNVKASHPNTEVMIMTAAPTLDTAISTLKDGAYDYVIKPFDEASLINAVRRCLDHRRLRHDLASERALRSELEAAYKDLQKVEELKEAFLSRFNHEIRTPMAEFLMALATLDEAVSALAEPQRKAALKKLVSVAKRGGERLKDTLTSLLSYSDLKIRRSSCR